MRTILISVDTLRADMAIQAGMGELFDQVFTNYFSTCNWTLPCHAALLSGMSVDHGCQWEWSYPETSKETSRLCEERKKSFKPVTTIAEEFKRRKVDSYAVVGGGFVSSWFGLNRGFRSWDEDKVYPFQSQDNLLDILPKNSFVFIHDWYVHDYYQDCDWDIRKMREKEFMDPHALSAKKLSRGKDAYYKRVKTMIGFLKKFLTKYRKDRIILVGDHGEGFFENPDTIHHGVYSDLLHREVSNPPLFTMNCDFSMKSYATIFDCDIMPLILEGVTSSLSGMLCQYSYRGKQLKVLLSRKV